MTPRRMALVILAVALPLAGCGKMGELERPAPMFGRKAATNAPARELPPPVTTVDRRDLNTDPDLPDLVAPQNTTEQPQ